jgi:hypothetical protein
MKASEIVFGVLAVLFLAVTISACGGTSGCTRLCLDVRQKLIEQMPDIEEEDVQCHEEPWSQVDSCDECEKIFNEKFDVAFTDGPTCEKYFF